MQLIRYETPRLPGVLDTNRWLDELLGNFSRWPNWESFFGAESRSLQPSADLYEDKDNYYVRMEFPGFKKKDLNVDLEREVLTVSAEHKEGENASTFSRSVTIPEGISQEQVAAKYEDGVLTVSLPKQEERKPKAIPIK